jgi:hypothetical protein
MLVGKMKGLDKKIHSCESPGEELQFLLWKAELNKELLEFWKALSK